LVSVTSLPALEDGLALLLERLKGLVSVLGVDDALVHLGLLLGPGPRHGLQRRPDGHGPAFANFLREAHALGQSGLARDLEDILCCTCAVTLVLGDNLDEAVRDAEEVGLGGGDAAAGEDEVAGAGEAHEGGQAVGAAGAGEDAEARLGEADGGVGGEDAEVRGEGELEAAAEGEGGDGGDGGDGEVGERGEGRVEVGEELGGPTGTIVSARAHLAQGQWF